MNNFLDALFFKLYALAKRTGNKEESLALFTAVCAISLIFSCLALTVIEYFACFIFHSTYLLGSIPVLLTILISVTIPFYLKYIYRNQGNMLLHIYKTENKYHNKRGSWIMVGFLITSFLFFLSMMWIRC